MKRSDFEPSKLADVVCEGKMLVFVRDFRHPRESVWAALTEPGQLSQWAPFESDRDLAKVGPATLTMIDADTRVASAAIVTRAEPPALLEYTWETDIMRWELAATETGTRLTLSHTVTERSAAPKMAAGWHICLDVAGHLLDGDPVGPIRGNEAKNFGWEELYRAYGRRLDMNTE